MAVYTPLDHRMVVSLVATYGLGKLNKMVGIPVGSVNTHYLLETSKGKVILKIDEAKSFPDAERELALLRFLHERRFPCPPHQLCNYHTHCASRHLRYSEMWYR